MSELFLSLSSFCFLGVWIPGLFEWDILFALSRYLTFSHSNINSAMKQNSITTYSYTKKTHNPISDNELQKV